MFSPECFPPTQEPDVPEGPVQIVGLRDEDREEVCQLLSEKMALIDLFLAALAFGVRRFPFSRE